ncbi:putative signal peptide protein [Puccinia sorghi]|uniref:Putative signal peptide protein n=1 Tax=Puccinia sorghi TaxID=27349 RepID=A0A0L6UXQ8_9BASI|nr:putative signal peptide protein [Puccinia sorghi]
MGKRGGAAVGDVLAVVSVAGNCWQSEKNAGRQIRGGVAVGDGSAAVRVAGNNWPVGKGCILRVSNMLCGGLGKPLAGPRGGYKIITLTHHCFTKVKTECPHPPIKQTISHPFPLPCSKYRLKTDSCFFLPLSFLLCLVLYLFFLPLFFISQLLMSSFFFLRLVLVFSEIKLIPFNMNQNLNIDYHLTHLFQDLMFCRFEPDTGQQPCSYSPFLESQKHNFILLSRWISCLAIYGQIVASLWSKFIFFGRPSAKITQRQILESGKQHQFTREHNGDFGLQSCLRIMTKKTWYKMKQIKLEPLRKRAFLTWSWYARIGVSCKDAGTGLLRSEHPKLESYVDQVKLMHNQKQIWVPLHLPLGGGFSSNQDVHEVTKGEFDIKSSGGVLLRGKKIGKIATPTESRIQLPEFFCGAEIEVANRADADIAATRRRMRSIVDRSGWLAKQREKLRTAFIRSFGYPGSGGRHVYLHNTSPESLMSLLSAWLLMPQDRCKVQIGLIAVLDSPRRFEPASSSLSSLQPVSCPNVMLWSFQPALCMCTYQNFLRRKLTEIDSKVCRCKAEAGTPYVHEEVRQVKIPLPQRVEYNTQLVENLIVRSLILSSYVDLSIIPFKLCPTRVKKSSVLVIDLILSNCLTFCFSLIIISPPQHLKFLHNYVTDHKLLVDTFVTNFLFVFAWMSPQGCPFQAHSGYLIQPWANSKLTNMYILNVFSGEYRMQRMMDKR